MASEFEMSMVGELSYFLGFQIKQCKDGTSISQEKYAKNLVKKFGLETAKPMRTPMGTNDHLSEDIEGEDADPTLYRSMIGSLLYLCASRPDLSFSVGVCLGLWYTKDTNGVLAEYSDADMAGCVDDRR
ncbi:uncharacterized mitochondrial protein AtMg00810-like, partial [Rutidosis leptorrhynchoides]|uniref:uncharacterized mitochondrial protein AtMg00810-like n=1 Tax=Rutidosis leptorrhynchoides TaxID=125765 RepID=UPI003A9995E0